MNFGKKSWNSVLKIYRIRVTLGTIRRPLRGSVSRCERVLNGSYSFLFYLFSVYATGEAKVYPQTTVAIFVIDCQEGGDIVAAVVSLSLTNTARKRKFINFSANAAFLKSSMSINSTSWPAPWQHINYTLQATSQKRLVQRAPSAKVRVFSTLTIDWEVNRPVKWCMPQGTMYDGRQSSEWLH